MAYTKVTPASWIERLQQGAFKDSTSAKKSLGRTAWPQQMKDRVTLLVDRHYGGHKLAEADINSVVSEELPSSERKPVKRRAPAKRRAPVSAAAVSYSDGDVSVRTGPYADLLGILEVVQGSLGALKAAHSIDNDISGDVRKEVEMCIDMVSVVVGELGERIPDVLKKALNDVRKQYQEVQDEAPPRPKAVRAATPVAPLPALDSGVPLESNDIALELWRKTKPSRVSKG